jgi:transcriptional regulator with XRE-family HTH domain
MYIQMAKSTKDLETFGANVKKLRQKYLPDESFSQAAMAARVAYKQLEKIESGKSDPRISTIQKICKGWGVPIEELMEPFMTKKEGGHRK